MTSITLSEIKAAQDRVAKMIAEFEAASAASSKTTALVVREALIELQPGEHYAGVILDAQGRVQHHLVLMAAEPESTFLTWQDARDWAERVGGSLPTRQEQSLLFGNCKRQLTSGAYWSNEQYSASYAWYQYFNSGTQISIDKSAELLVRAVRRVPIEG